MGMLTPCTRTRAKVEKCVGKAKPEGQCMMGVLQKGPKNCGDTKKVMTRGLWGNGSVISDSICCYFNLFYFHTFIEI